MCSVFMKKESKKFLGLFLFSIFMLSVLGVFVSADTINTLAGSFDSLFTDWSQGMIGSNVAKIIFFIMVGFLIYLILGELPILSNNKAIVLPLSFLVSFLATAYITPKEVFSLLNSYSALGLTLITLIPLMILAGLTYRAATAPTDRGKVQLIMIQYFAWILFAIYSTYRVIYDWAVAKEGSGVMNAILLATAIAAVVVVLFNRYLVKMIVHKYVQSSKEAAQETFDKAGDALKNLRKLEEKAAGTRK